MAFHKIHFVRSVVVPGILFAAVAIGANYLFGHYNKPRFVHYTAFGIDIPVNYPIHGIDVSHYQHDIGWPDVAAMEVQKIKIGFVFIKATEGVDDEDDSFDDNWRDARATNLPRGAYHFFIASKSGKAQAANFIDRVKLLKGDLPPVLDIEQSNGASVADLQQRAREWLNMVELRYKVKPIIYTNIDFYKNFLAGKFDDYPLWIAHYLVEDKPRIDRNWTFWQHNEMGHVNGVDAYVDFNVFNGDSTDFRQLLVK